MPGFRHSGGDVLDEQHGDCGVPTVGLTITGWEPLARYGPDPCRLARIVGRDLGGGGLLVARERLSRAARNVRRFRESALRASTKLPAIIPDGSATMPTEAIATSPPISLPMRVRGTTSP